MEVRKWRREIKSLSFFTPNPWELFGFDLQRAINGGDQEREEKRGVLGERKEVGKKGEEDGDDSFFFTQTAEEFLGHDLLRVINGETQLVREAKKKEAKEEKEGEDGDNLEVLCNWMMGRETMKEVRLHSS